MKKFAWGLALSAMALSASAEVLTFEGIPFSNFPSNLNGYGLSNTATFAPPGYGNLKWSADFRVLEAANFVARTGAPAGNGYTHGLVSGSYVATNGGAAPVSVEALTDDGLFNFESVYLGAAWYNGLQVDVTGYRDGVAVYNTRTGPLGYTSTLLQFNWTNIDKLSFASVDGTGAVIDNQSTYNHAFVMDNLSITTVPEVESHVLALLGLGVVGCVAHGRKRMTKQA
jgi:hypothetical protein